eukprot:s1070_g16.t2
MTCSLRLKLVLARIQHGATVSASQETIQVGMAEAMIQRLAQEDPEAEAARPDCQGDLTGRMTPPAQPTAFDANTPPDPKELANKLEKVPGRARRSSMVRRGALDEAARSAAKNHRKSIAGIQKSKLIDDDANKDRPMAARCDSILQAVANTRKRNRLSICKAVETLEAAGLGDEPDKEAVAQQLEMVQKCLLEARKKHRDTVAKVAMETVSPTSATTDEKPKFQMSASAKAFNPNQQSIEEKIRSAVKAAHQRAKQERGEVAAPPRGHDQWGNPYAAWGSGYDQTGYGYAQAYHPGYNQANAFNQCYDPSWNNQMGYAQGQHWQQPQQAWTQAGAGQNCWGVRLFRSNCCLWWGLLQLLWRKLLWLWPASGSDSASSIFRPGPLAQRSMGRGLDARHFDCTRCDTDMLQNAHVTRKLWLGGRAYAKVPVEYWRCDVLAHDFVQSLARRVEGIGRPAAILAMHLCGRLSLQAISAFRQIDLIRCCVLGPCCLPHSSEAPKELQDVYGSGMSDEDQFDAWAAHLEKLLRRIPGVSVTRSSSSKICLEATAEIVPCCCAFAFSPALACRPRATQMSRCPMNGTKSTEPRGYQSELVLFPVACLSATQCYCRCSFVPPQLFQLSETWLSPLPSLARMAKAVLDALKATGAADLSAAIEAVSASMFKIKDLSEGSPCADDELKGREILDSRGNPTVEVDLITEGGVTVTAAVPSGASTGVHEACELRDGDKGRYLGKGVLKAVESVNTVLNASLKGFDVSKQKELDDKMIELDGTLNKSKLGANAILDRASGVSMAAAKAAAQAKGVPLYQHFAELAGNSQKLTLPVPCFNVINGGSHAGNKLAFQEYFIIPVGASSFKDAMRIGSECYHTLKGIIKKKFGGDATLIGDEGGFAPPCDAKQGVELIMEAIEKAGYKDKCKIGMDVAASEFKQENWPCGPVGVSFCVASTVVPRQVNFASTTDEEGSHGLLEFTLPVELLVIADDPVLRTVICKEGTDCYDLGTWYAEAEKTPELKMTGSQLADFYADLCANYPLITIEDPFDQDDWAAWTGFTAKVGGPTQVVGDDLTVTNVTRVKKAIDDKACNALLLKVNQIGTVSESIDAVKLCKTNGWGVMCSHRSGETEDTTIADLASCSQVTSCYDSIRIKTGAPCRSDRNAKYNQLMRIEEELGDKCAYAGTGINMRSQWNSRQWNSWCFVGGRSQKEWEEAKRSNSNSAAKVMSSWNKIPGPGVLIEWKERPFTFPSNQQADTVIPVMSFVINTADNFYMGGVESTKDDYWSMMFEELYTDESLQIPWLSSLGNLVALKPDRDPGHNIRRGKPCSQAMIDYDTEHDWQWPNPKTVRWVMPMKGNDRWYMKSFKFPKANVTIDVFVIDTNKAHIESQCKSHCPGQMKAESWRQKDWLLPALEKSKADWILVLRELMGRRFCQSSPIPVTCQEDGGWACSAREFRGAEMMENMRDRGVSVYMAGHVHQLRHDRHPSGIEAIISGSGGGYQSAGGGTSYTLHESQDYGFATMHVEYHQISVEYFNDEGRRLWDPVVIPRIDVVQDILQKSCESVSSSLRGTFIEASLQTCQILVRPPFQESLLKKLREAAIAGRTMDMKELIGKAKDHGVDESFINSAALAGVKAFEAGGGMAFLHMKPEIMKADESTFSGFLSTWTTEERLPTAWTTLFYRQDTGACCAFAALRHGI